MKILRKGGIRKGLKKEKRGIWLEVSNEFGFRSSRIFPFTLWKVSDFVVTKNDLDCVGLESPYFLL